MVLLRSLPYLVLRQVSRCGMVYMEPHLLGWEPVLESWLNELPETLTEDNRTLIKDMFLHYCPCLLNFVRKAGFSELSPTSDSNLVKSCMNLMDCQLSSVADATLMAGVSGEQLKAWLECFFLFACTWSLGASLDSKGRKAFDGLFKELMTEGLSLENKRRYKILQMVEAPAKKIVTPFPEAGNVFEYQFEREVCHDILT